MLKKLLFPNSNYGNSGSVALLIIRVAFGTMLMIHGWGKITGFSDIAPHFVWGELGLGLVIFAEFFCAFAVIVGFLFRMALIPLVINMFVALMVGHGFKLVGEGNGELAFLYLVVFVGLMIAGPGKFALDRLFYKMLLKNNTHI